MFPNTNTSFRPLTLANLNADDAKAKTSLFPASIQKRKKKLRQQAGK